MNNISEKIWKILLNRKFWMIFQVFLLVVLFILYISLNFNDFSDHPRILSALAIVLLGVTAGFPWGIKYFFLSLDVPNEYYVYLGSFVYYLVFIWFLFSVKNKNKHRIIAIILLVFMLLSFSGCALNITSNVPFMD